MLFTNNKYLQIILIILLLPFTFIYWLGVTIRHFLYDSNFISSYTPDIFTVSIGNITAGGTGKTPTVIAIVNSLKIKGYKPLIVTGGYGRKSSGRVIINDKTPVAESGDEPMTIFQKTASAVVCDKDRSSAVKDLGKNFDIVVLDDAFQHRKIKKNIDAVLIDESRFFGNGLMLPSGILRDKISRLKKCDLIILSKVKDINSTSVKEKLEKLKKIGKKIIISKLEPSKITDGKNETGLDSIRSKNISLFCGIADHQGFFGIFKDQRIISEKAFRDHYSYSQNDFEFMREMKKNSDMMITTYKDFVKLPATVVEECNISYLDIELSFYDQDLKKIDIAELIKGYDAGTK